METSPKIKREVIECCKAGDEKAFAEIVLHYQKRVFNIAYRMLGNMEEAKDLAQEVSSQSSNRSRISGKRSNSVRG